MAVQNETLVRAQAVSGVLFAVFLAVHLANTALAAFSEAWYERFQAAVGPWYRFPLVEFGLILVPLVVHLSAGVLRARRRRPAAGVPWRMRLHRWSAWFLALVIFGHIAAVRGPQVLFGVAPEFEGVAFALWWQPFFFYPYYLLLALAGLYHGANGLLYALGMLRIRVSPRWREGRRFWIPVGAVAVLLVASVLGFGGWLHPTSDALDHPYARLYEKWLGVDLARKPVADNGLPER